MSDMFSTTQKWPLTHCTRCKTPLTWKDIAAGRTLCFLCLDDYEQAIMEARQDALYERLKAEHSDTEI